jgi:hypothetical protein
VKRRPNGEVEKFKAKKDFLVVGTPKNLDYIEQGIQKHVELDKRGGPKNASDKNDLGKEWLGSITNTKWIN